MTDELARERTRRALRAAIGSGKSPGAELLLAELERGWARMDERAGEAFRHALAGGWGPAAAAVIAVLVARCRQGGTPDGTQGPRVTR